MSDKWFVIKVCWRVCGDCCQTWQRLSPRQLIDHSPQWRRISRVRLTCNYGPPPSFSTFGGCLQCISDRLVVTAVVVVSWPSLPLQNHNFGCVRIRLWRTLTGGNTMNALSMQQCQTCSQLRLISVAHSFTHSFTLGSMMSRPSRVVASGHHSPFPLLSSFSSVILSEKKLKKGNAIPLVYLPTWPRLVCCFVCNHNLMFVLYSNRKREREMGGAIGAQLATVRLIQQQWMTTTFETAGYYLHALE